jgi:hypothetical protein
VDLNEIETKADELLEQMYRDFTGPDGAAEMRDICTRMDVLERAARIKATVAFRKEREDERAKAEGMRERELAAMETVAANMPTAAPCGAASPEIVLAGGAQSKQYCRWPAGHAGPHKSPQGTEWIADERCGQRWNWGGEHFEICTLPPQHSGAHHNVVTGVRSDSDLEGGA